MEPRAFILSSMEMTATASANLQSSASDSPARDQTARRGVHLVQPVEPRVLLIRDLHRSDVSCLEWHGGADLRLWYQAQWKNHEAGRVHVLVADFNDFPVGQVAVHWHGKPTHPLVPDLQSLRVFGAFRGLGIGSLLLDCAEQLVAQSGHAQVSLAVGTENPRARALYERRGYRVFGEAYDDEWTYQNARGETCSACETVFDMVKNLSVENLSVENLSPEVPIAQIDGASSTRSS